MSGAEPAAALLSTIGGAMSGIGAFGQIVNDGIEGKFDAANFAIQVGSELLNRYLKNISGDDTVKNIMHENAVNELGNGLNYLKQDKK